MQRLIDQLIDRQVGVANSEAGQAMPHTDLICLVVSAAFTPPALRRWIEPDRRIPTTTPQSSADLSPLVPQSRYVDVCR